MTFTIISDTPLTWWLFSPLLLWDPSADSWN